MKTKMSVFILATGLVFSGQLFAQAGMGAGGAMGGGGSEAPAEPRDRCTEETKGQLPVNVAAIDSNGNGVVDKDELAEHVAGGQLDNLFGRWDADSSGGLDSQEFCFRQ